MIVSAYDHGLPTGGGRPNVCDRRKLSPPSLPHLTTAADPREARMASLDRFQPGARGTPPGKASDAASSRHSFVQALGPLMVLYLLYTMVRWVVIDRGELVGERNALHVLRLERWLGIDFELTLQKWALAHSHLLWIFNHYYVFAFFPVLILAAIWGYRAAPDEFQTVRRVFAVSLALAVMIFALVPLAPPRLLPASYGYVDTLMLYGPHYYGDATGASIFNAYGSLPSVVNEYAAMPSMHVGWSIIAGWLLYVASGRRWWVGALAAAHIVMMETVVVTTGNHFLVDGVAGALVVLLSWGIVRWHEGWARSGSLQPEPNPG